MSQDDFEDKLEDKPADNFADTQDHQLPMLPLRDVVVYPQMVIPLFVGREKSIWPSTRRCLSKNKFYW